MNTSHLVETKEIQGLTRWARVAFAARCARHAQRILGQMDLEQGREPIDVCEKAVRLAEESAALGKPHSRLLDAMRETGQLAYAAVTPPLGVSARNSRKPGAETADLVVCNVAHAAFAAARVAREDSLDNVLDALNYATEAAWAAGKEGMARTIRQDFDRLNLANSKEGWTDASPVSLSSVGLV